MEAAAPVPSEEEVQRTLQSVAELATSARYVGAPRAAVGSAVFDTQAPRIKEDILRMVIQYLQNEGYVASVMTLQDEANVKTKEKLNRRALFKRMRNSILVGDWAEVEKLCARSSVKGYKSLLYAIYKQQYLELVDKQEYQKAFQLLSRRLKPLENMGATQQEFKDLCYLLTCKSIMDVPSCRDWEGVMSNREKLIDQFHSVLFEFEGDNLPDARGLAAPVPPNRLTTLLSQAAEHQIARNRYHPNTTPRIISLLEDYRTFVVPNAQRQRFVGHTRNVKCLEFVGTTGATLATGGSDNTVRLWETATATPIQTLVGHDSRIWDLAATQSGDALASASADGTIRIWRRGAAVQADPEPQREPEWSWVETLSGGKTDCYSVSFHPDGQQLVSGGYDKVVRLYDAARGGAAIKTFEGHQALVSRAVFSPHGKLVITGSKDATLRIWDLTSGVCIQTLKKHLGEVSNVEMNAAGTLLLSSSKDNCYSMFRMLLQAFEGSI